MVTGMAKTAGNLVGDAAGKIGGEKVESLVKNVVDIPAGMVEKVVDDNEEKKELAEVKKNLKPVQIDTSQNTPAPNPYLQPADESNPFDG
jgi:hypothetical protein